MPDLIRNRVTERDIRDWLRDHDFDEGSIQFQSVELHAIERPGWKQLFRFEALARLKQLETQQADEPLERKKIWGVALDDERKRGDNKFEVFVFEDQSQQSDLLKELGKDMLLSSRDRSDKPGAAPLLVIAAIMLSVLFAIAMFRKFFP